MRIFTLKFFISLFVLRFLFNPAFAGAEGECEKSFSVKPADPEQLIQYITQGAMLSRGQELEFLFHLKKTFGDDLADRGLKDVLDIKEQYPPGKLDKLPVRAQKITFVIKQKTIPKSLTLFLKSFKNRANRVRKIFYISNNWQLWAKMLLFEALNNNLSKKEKRDEFFKYLNSSPLNKPVKEFIKNKDLSDFPSQTVKQFIESPLAHYKEKTIVLYKVLDIFRANSIKQGRQDISENLSIAMAELIHITGFNNQNYLNQLKDKDPLKVMEAVRQILLERDVVAMDLGFNEWHYKGLQSFLLDSFKSSRVKRLKNELSKIEIQEEKILKDLKNQPEVNSYTETFTLRPLTLQESPFRGCLGKDCSTGNYFEKALDPAYLYFTLTDGEFISHGQITIILGRAENHKGETIKTAFVDQIQNIPNHHIIGTLEAIRQSLNEQGYLLALPKNLGTTSSGLSNSSLTRNFVKDEILTSLTNKFQAFKPETTDLDFKDSEYSRANLQLDLWEFKLPKTINGFEIQPLEIFKPKHIDKSFKMHDWFLKAIKSNDEKDQLLLVSSLSELVDFNFLSSKQALNYLQSKIKDKSLSFKLRKRALFSAIQIKALKKYTPNRYDPQQIKNLEKSESATQKDLKKIIKAEQSLLKDFKFIESLLLEFSKPELTTIIGEMSNWKKSTTLYRTQFILKLSYLFDTNMLSQFVESFILFEKIADLSIKDNYEGDTTLHRAVEKGYQQNVEFLLKLGVDPNIKNHYGETGLHHAARKGYKDIVNMLINNGANLDIKNNLGETALLKAAENGHQQIVKILLQTGVDPKVKTTESDTALHYATKGNHPEIIQMLIKAGVNLDSKDNIGKTALHIAIYYGHKQVVKQLLKAGIDPNIKDENTGWTALHYAVEGRYQEIVQLLIEVGANLDSQSHFGGTALHNAAGRGYKEIVQLLLKAGVDPNIKNNNTGETALYHATSYGNQQVVEFLYEWGADPKIKNNDNETALHRATDYGYKQIVKLLIEWGLDINRQNNDGDTALHRATLGGHKEILLFLHESGADLNITNNKGNTALHYAYRHGYNNIIRILIDLGTDPKIKNNEGKTPNEILKIKPSPLAPSRSSCQTTSCHRGLF